MLLLPLYLGCTSCHWHEAETVIAMADSIDQTQHVIYDDTAALGLTIRQLDNPLGRLFKRSTLGKAYYYMGRNLEDSYQQITEAAECYIEADRLQIDDPIYRGRVNSCMGYICAQNNNDSLALIFYERASEDFKESGNEGRYAHSLLDRIEFNVKFHNYIVADSLLWIAYTYSLDSAYRARYLETRGLYHYEQQQYDSALVYFERGLNYWQSETEKCFSYLKIMQSYYFGNISMDSAVLYAHKLILISHNPNYISNAYYCLMQDAKAHNNTSLLSLYAHSREDANRLLNQTISVYAEATPKLEDYLQNPHPLRWMWVSLTGFLLICILLLLLLISYRKKTSSELQIYKQKNTDLSVRLTERETLLSQHKYDADLAKILKKYPTPPNQWNDYSQLKKDIEPFLHSWLNALECTELTNREKVFCVFVFVYRHFNIATIAEYMNNTERAVRVQKTRVAQKLGVTSAQLIDYLHNLHVEE